MTVVDRLDPSSSGCWLITTATSSHVLDLDARLWTRLPRADSGLGVPADAGTVRLTRIDVWPQVGRQARWWYDDPNTPSTEWWHATAWIRSIEPAPQSAGMMLELAPPRPTDKSP